MISPGEGLVYIAFGSIIVDKFHCRSGVILFLQMLNLIGNILLSVWNIKEGAKWFAFILQYTAFATLPLVYSLQSEICSDNQWERSIILVSMNMAAQSSIAWISVLVWKTADAHSFSRVIYGLLLIIYYDGLHDNNTDFLNVNASRNNITPAVMMNHPDNHLSC
ncbi:BAQ_1a_G0017720.mRNA.1.CDS.1 [Saccharomyces cerevisiae]|nr:BAQ_1a_G0017720.mRNA.1.CDS.1 [Saccharomyces cerevisiae]CAI4456430.1 CCC_1a_G0017690.mRNA.1.CDS.1 [Saccharomyces cerevisiae]CAI7111359.1 BAQ_1a_G0017720.mRNA.1.CDS.1 [Saccharomyces cerevisiae]CAI7281063.1 CCC_1a_G0017690.mRNA.1.CDS.1 [Saccharomyces cerevisiae]